jgi:hypothetical protein
MIMAIAPAMLAIVTSHLLPVDAAAVDTLILRASRTPRPGYGHPRIGLLPA